MVKAGIRGTYSVQYLGSRAKKRDVVCKLHCAHPWLEVASWQTDRQEDLQAFEYV